MNIKHVIGGVLVAGSLYGAYLGGQKAGQASTKPEIENISKENIGLKSKIHVLEKDMFELKKEHAQTLLPLQMDTLKKTPVGKRAPEFLERIVNNATFIDSINKTDKAMLKVVENMSTDEIVDIHLSSRYGSKASHNLVNFFKNTFNEVKVKL